ncbi:MAG: SDR family oxidoreductase [Leptolyngbya sp. SIO1E4]|nr:SDR family oxidoreductase [Leptolyngbya sp. SIO1E4]
MQETAKVLVAGASGYLGGYVTKELLRRGINTKILVRNRNKINIHNEKLEIIEAEVTKPETISDLLADVDVVISTVGITRQKDGLRYMNVDYQANANLLSEAQRANVKRFIYVSVLNGEQLRKLKICEAKERFRGELRSSGLDYTIIRSNEFFSDMADFLKMAKGGKVYLFGDGSLKLNPIHGEDLAKVVVDSISQSPKEINIGGPDLLTQNEIAELALKAYAKPIRIIHLPNWIRKGSLWLVRTFTDSKTYGPIEFFLTTMAMDMNTPQYGEIRLETFFYENAT